MGGASLFPRFINNYESVVTDFRHAPRGQPVIILIDNDSGAGSVFSVLKNFGAAITHVTNAPFYHIKRNLYLVKTPEVGITGVSQIEDCFDAKTLATILSGKSFNKHNDTDTATQYGKAIFADVVVGPNVTKIDFAGFSPLFDRIVAVIENHKKVVSVGAN